MPSWPAPKLPRVGVSSRNFGPDHGTKKTRSILRRHAVPAPQDVEVLEIYNQAEVAEDFSTPTPPATVARIRATNFDGEIVEIIVDIKDLEFYN